MHKNLKKFYNESLVPSMMQDFGYKNIQEVPKITKISINRGLGEASKNSKEFEASVKELATISGQKPVINNARKSVAGFKIRDGMEVGASVTLRQEKMYTFLTKLINIVFPRIRDFRGIPTDGFDGRGNYNIGFKEQLMFPEISYDEVIRLHGFDIAICTTAKTDEEAFALLKGFGLPFKNS